MPDFQVAPEVRGALRGGVRTQTAAAAIACLAAIAGAGIARAEPPRIYAITGAKVHAAPDRLVENGTIVVRDGLIEAVGPALAAPADAHVIDAQGMSVTYGFIDACSHIGQKDDPPAGGSAGGGPGRAPQTPPGPAHPIALVRAEHRVADGIVIDDAAFEKHHKMGFTTALSLPRTGLFRGEAALLNLGHGSVADNLVRPQAGQVIAFEQGRFGTGYPNSLMGSIAAIRQTFLDARRWAEWQDRYARDPVGLRRPDQTAAFAAIAPIAAGRGRALFDTEDAFNVPRALDLGREFSLDAVIIGSGMEHMEEGALERIRRSGWPVILPLAYPKDPDVSDPDEAIGVTLQTLERWDRAPEAALRLHEAGIPFALGTCRLEGASEFPGNLRKAIDRGLPVEAAIAALTVTPARMFGVDRAMGRIEKGRAANLAIWEGATPEHGVFAEKAAVIRVLVDGIPFEMDRKESKADPDAKVDPRGTWSVTFTIGGRTINRAWVIGGEEGRYDGTAETQQGTVAFESVRLAGNEMTVKIPGRGGRPGQEIAVIITGDTLEGSGEFPGGTSYAVKGKRTSGPEGGAL